MPVSGGGSHYSWDHLYGYGKYGEVQETWGEYAERRLQEIAQDEYDGETLRLIDDYGDYY